MPSIEITVPLPLNLANSRMHHMKKHVAKNKYWRTLDMRCQVRLIPAPPRIPFDKVSIRSVMYLGAAMDDDNAMNRHKWILDWLKTRGYIVDDRKKNVEWEGLPRQVIKRSNSYRIELTITPIA